ncbi:unnamed protein product [Amoebophrya sp. A25]|nr:unnamed protein product [Amoebophrya sp. A25]|eukprot:GSA25T00026943001.1
MSVRNGNGVKQRSRNKTPEVSAKRGQRQSAEVPDSKGGSRRSTLESDNNTTTSDDGSTGGISKAGTGYRGLFLPPQGARNLAFYEYHAVPPTLTDQFLNPYWTMAANLIPTWISPNAVTLSGMIAQMSAAALFVGHYCDAWDAPLCKAAGLALGSTEDICVTGPASSVRHLHGASKLYLAPNTRYIADLLVYTYAIVCMVYYHIADAADGKHARNTGQCSPLGALFDHACDAWATLFIFLCSTCSIFLRLPNEAPGATSVYDPRTHAVVSTIIFFYHFAVFGSFFGGQWFHLHTGTLDTANVSEGQFGYILLLLCMMQPSLREASRTNYIDVPWGAESFRVEYMTIALVLSAAMPLYVIGSAAFQVFRTVGFRKSICTFVVPMGINCFQSAVLFFLVPLMWEEHMLKLFLFMSVVSVYLSLRCIVCQLCAIRYTKTNMECYLPVTLPICAFAYFCSDMHGDAQFNSAENRSFLIYWLLFYMCGLTLFFMADVIATICSTLRVPFLAPLKKPWKRTNFENRDRFPKNVKKGQ